MKQNASSVTGGGGGGFPQQRTARLSGAR
jgi:hypothetical protein